MSKLLELLRRPEVGHQENVEHFRGTYLEILKDLGPVLQLEPPETAKIVVPLEEARDFPSAEVSTFFEESRLLDPGKPVEVALWNTDPSVFYFRVDVAPQGMTYANGEVYEPGSWAFSLGSTQGFELLWFGGYGGYESPFSTLWRQRRYLNHVNTHLRRREELFGSFIDFVETQADQLITRR